MAGELLIARASSPITDSDFPIGRVKQRWAIRDGVYEQLGAQRGVASLLGNHQLCDQATLPQVRMIDMADALEISLESRLEHEVDRIHPATWWMDEVRFPPEVTKQ